MFVSCAICFNNILCESDIPNLYHVVFSDDLRTVRILGNDLEEVSGGHFTLLSSS